jgi:hypothetical protein
LSLRQPIFLTILKFSCWTVLYMHGWFFASVSFLRQRSPSKSFLMTLAVNSDSPLQTMQRVVTLHNKKYREFWLSVIIGSPEFLHIIQTFTTPSSKLYRESHLSVLNNMGIIDSSLERIAGSQSTIPISPQIWKAFRYCILALGRTHS